MSGTNRELVERLFAAIRKCDADVLADEVFTEDGVIEIPFGRPDPWTRVEGRSQVREYFRRAFEVLPGVEQTITEVHEMVNGDLVVEHTSKGPVMPDGKPFGNTYISVFRFRDGGVCLWREYADPITWTQALGLAEFQMK